MKDRIDQFEKDMLVLYAQRANEVEEADRAVFEESVRTDGATPESIMEMGNKMRGTRDRLKVFPRFLNTRLKKLIKDMEYDGFIDDGELDKQVDQKEPD